MDRWKRFAHDKMRKYENKSKLNNWQDCDSRYEKFTFIIIYFLTYSE